MAGILITAVDIKKLGMLKQRMLQPILLDRC